MRFYEYLIDGECFSAVFQQELHQARGVLTSSQMLRLMVQELSTPFSVIFSPKKKKNTSQIEPGGAFPPRPLFRSILWPCTQRLRGGNPKAPSRDRLKKKFFFNKKMVGKHLCWHML